MFLNDTKRNRHPKPCTLPNSFRRKKWIKYFFLDLLRHPDSGIPNRYFNRGICLPCLYKYSPFSRDSLNSVGKDIHKDLVDLSRQTIHFWYFSKLFFDLNPVFIRVM